MYFPCLTAHGVIVPPQGSFYHVFVFILFGQEHHHYLCLLLNNLGREKVKKKKNALCFFIKLYFSPKTSVDFNSVSRNCNMIK